MKARPGHPEPRYPKKPFITVNFVAGFALALIIMLPRAPASLVQPVTLDFSSACVLILGSSTKGPHAILPRRTKNGVTMTDHESLDVLMAAVRSSHTYQVRQLTFVTRINSAHAFNR